MVFATHYLEEADLYADRIVLMAHGRIVADGPTTEIKAMVGGRTIRGTLPGAGATELDAVRRLPGVTGAELHGEAVSITSADSDATLRALLPAYPALPRHRDPRRRPRGGLPRAHHRPPPRPRRPGAVPMSAITAPTDTTPTRRPRSRTYVRFEIVRALRNVRFFVFSLVFPLVLFLLVAGPNRHQHIDGIGFPLYYMTGMAAWGTMTAVVAGGARIALERSIGWNRQLRVTPLSTRTYLVAKVLTGYLVALFSIVLLYAAGSLMGVRLSAGHWLLMTVMILVGLVPFAALGILLGHLLTPDAMGPAMGGLTSLLALLGGAWGPVASGGFIRNLSELCRPTGWCRPGDRDRRGALAAQGLDRPRRVDAGPDPPVSASLAT